MPEPEDDGFKAPIPMNPSTLLSWESKKPSLSTP